MKPVKIARRVDEPPHLLMWSADEIAPMLLGLTVGIVIGKALICFLIGLAVTKLYSRFRDNHPDGVILHLLYWSGLLTTRARCMRNPYIRRFLP